MATATLRALASEWSKEGQASMDHLMEESGFLQVAQVLEASHGMTHKYKRVDALPSFTVINPGGSVGDTTVDNDVFESHLKIIKANQSEPADIVDDWPSGKAAYFNSQRPVYLESFGQKLSDIIYYGNNSTFGDVTGFIGLHQIAKAYGNVIQAGGASGSRTSIFAVKFRPGPNGCALLYDPAIVDAQSMMKSEPILNGMKSFEVTNTTGNLKKTVYQVEHLGKSGFLSSSKYDVAAYTQLQDDTNDRPTAKNMDLLLDYVRYKPGSTFLFMNRAARRMLNLLKDSKLQTTPGETEYYKWLETWNGVPIIIDDNIVSTEDTTLD